MSMVVYLILAAIVAAASGAVASVCVITMYREEGRKQDEALLPIVIGEVAEDDG